MPRAWVWLQLLLGWLPVWALFTVLIAIQHEIPVAHATELAARTILPAALLGILVRRLARRMPWPRRFSVGFVVVHLVAAPLYGMAWLAASSLVESVVRGRLVLSVGPGFGPFLAFGIWLYLMVAGISYALDGTERAARAEATAARMELAALRAQLHPHFLFNALHTVVQLIPTEPARAAEAAEQVGALLRATIAEDRDLIALADEWAFVSRYLELERLRFGDRLRVHADVPDALRDARVPSFALQTLVENAVRHGAAPRVEPTDIAISAARAGRNVVLRVREWGDGELPPRADGAGTGLARLRERLAALYGDAARLTAERGRDGAFEASVTIPYVRDEPAAEEPA